MLFTKTKVFDIEMGFTRQEFITLLELQNKLTYQRSGNQIQFKFADKTLLVILGEEGIRQIASARLPMLTVHFDCSAMEQLEQEQFMKLFLNKFHKGGG